MPDQPESTPAPIPRIVPADWEEGEGFRETLLLHITDRKANVTLRALGSLFLELSLDFNRYWPDRPEGMTRSELRAAVADLRHLEGFLSSVGSEHEEAVLDPDDEALSRFASQEAIEVGRIADRIEEKLAG
jgi:hypothetical protein